MSEQDEHMMDHSDDEIIEMVDDDDEEETSQPFSLHTLPKRNFYLTRRGKILQSTTERYLRDDLGFGTMLIPSTDSGSKKSAETIAGKITQLVPWTIDNANSLWHTLVSTTNQWDDAGGNATIRVAVVDTNVLLHHMDVLEYLRDNADDNDDANNDKGHKHHAIANAIVIPQTALEECRHRSLVMYRRATDLVRSSTSEDDNGSKNKKRKRCVIVFADVHHVDTQIKAAKDDVINDENDARLRKVAEYYGRALYNSSKNKSNKVEVVFLSDDAASRKLALLEQPEADDGDGLYYKTRSMREHVTLLQKEDATLNLLDMVAQFNTGDNKSIKGDQDGGIAQNCYPPHIADRKSVV